MPTLLNEDGHRFSFYSADLDEPPHVHVTRDRKQAKVWLDPVAVARNGGFRPVEVRKVLRIIEAHRDEFLETWNDYLRDR